MKKIEIAVIDSGVEKDLLRNSIKNDIVIDKDGLSYANSNSSTYSWHGTNCALIIEKYCKYVDISSVCILGGKGTGMVSKLEPALEVCLQNDIRVVYLSFGSTHYNDKAEIRNVINHYANKNMIIVAASSNDGYKTFPASFTNVIGVVAGDTYCTESDLQVHKGIDFTAFSEHNIKNKSNFVRLGRNNSYAAPFVTAFIGNLMQKKNCRNICEVREHLFCEGYRPENFICYPDWIEFAWVSTECRRSIVPFYFKERKGNYKTNLSHIDTLVLKNRKELAKFIYSGKHIVYLGEGRVKQSVHGIHFWSKESRIMQIKKSAVRPVDINIPIIICKIDKWQDEMLWLFKLRKYFGDDGYNIYPISETIESVLYDMEYIPKQLLRKKNMDQIHNFLYWQTYFNQSDAVLFMLKSQDYIKIGNNDVDLLIDITGKEEITVKIYFDKQEKISYRMVEKETNVVYKVYLKIVEFLTEGTDE